MTSPPGNGAKNTHLDVGERVDHGLVGAASPRDEAIKPA